MTECYFRRRLRGALVGGIAQIFSTTQNLVGAGLCGEGACPRWVAERPQNQKFRDCYAVQRGQAPSPHKPAPTGFNGVLAG
ncbi:hypothetical protein FHW68_000243 [Pseudomonas sp. Tn43]|nr:hypothetical protein [Pseudomonas sp. Tn43]